MRRAGNAKGNAIELYLAAGYVTGKFISRSTEWLFDESTVSSLGRQCHYDSTTRSYALSSRSDSSEAESRRRASPKNSVNSPIFLDQGGCPFESDVATTITAQLSHALGDLGDLKVVQETAQKYFASIHLWYPTISEDSFYERLPNTFSQPSAAYSLLILGMGLITTIPILDEPLPPLYTIVKSLIAVAEASNIHSIEVVQTRLLVSLFEVGHGLETAAFISLASTARAAAAIGLNETIYPQCKDTDTVLSVLSDSEEGMRVWWGIVMLDRCVLYDLVFIHSIDVVTNQQQKLFPRTR